MKYGERLRKARNHAKLSQEKLAELVGIKQPSIQYLEDTENNSPGSAFTVQFARACNVSPDWLADELGEMLPMVYQTTDPKIIAVAKIMEPLPTYAKDAVVEDVDKVAKLVARAKANGTDG